MKSRRQPHLEGLEGRRLLSGLSATLTESAPVAQPGQPIVFTLQETNTSARPITVDEGPSLDGFVVQQGGRTIWQSNAGIQPMFVMAHTLQPGQSLSLSATWNGKAQDGSAPSAGTYTVVNQMDPQTTTTLKVSETSTASSQTSPVGAASHLIAPVSTSLPSSSSPSTPASNAAQASAPSPIVLTVVTNRFRYARGHRVEFAASLRNAGTSVVTLPIASAESFAVKEGSRTVWQYNRVVSGPGTITLQPGQAIEYTSTWNGRSHPRGVLIRPGTYTVDASAEGFSASSTFVVGGRIRHRV